MKRNIDDEMELIDKTLESVFKVHSCPEALETLTDTELENLLNDLQALNNQVEIAIEEQRLLSSTEIEQMEDVLDSVSFVDKF